MRKGFKHGKWVRTPNPHVDVDVLVDKQTGKEDVGKPGSRVKVPDSEMKFKKPKKSRGLSPGRPAGPGKPKKITPTIIRLDVGKDGKNTFKVVESKAKGGRAGFRGGGRTNLLEELGRVEGESSNRNRRAEVSRIHGELNRGYKHGGSVGAAKRGFNKKILRNS